jgi:hypothetical protein
MDAVFLRGEASKTRSATEGLRFCHLLLASACGNETPTPGYETLSKHVEKNRVGAEQDQWIEMRNLAGEWERTSLFFGHYGAHEACETAIAGIREASVPRENRSTPANLLPNSSSFGNLAHSGAWRHA